MKKVFLKVFNLVFVFLAVQFFHPVLAQKSAKVVNIGFYNLENLYDTDDDTLIQDEEFLPSGVKNYTLEIYHDKLKRLESVISKLGKDISPDGVSILGVAEIENQKVLEDLIKMPLLSPLNFGIVHYNSPDFRGVDVALLYQKKYFRPIFSKPIKLPIFNTDSTERPTRDILYVKGIIDYDTLHIFVNHWPSRRGGEAAEKYRIMGAKICKNYKDSILLANPNAKILVMGDLNDNPNDLSLKDEMKAVRSFKKMQSNEMYNPYYNFYTKGIGTTAYRDAWSLFDQIILSPSLTKNNGGYYFYKATVFNQIFLVEKSGQYKGYPQRTFSGDTYNYGYSDHFPVYITLVKEVIQ